ISGEYSGVYVDGSNDLAIEDSTITASQIGLDYVDYSSNLSVKNSAIDGGYAGAYISGSGRGQVSIENSAVRTDGCYGIYAEWALGPLAITGSTVESPNGIAVYAYSANSVSIDGSTITGAAATGTGGAIPSRDSST
ncbi:MAG: right-handed parallel beta-helix repeat-containing protein, partial [Firmicutes bacterium]|nr:right-handed parallel beta-helix repeat-containing protein [Bacillota bacterium]